MFVLVMVIILKNLQITEQNIFNKWLFCEFYLQLI